MTIKAVLFDLDETLFDRTGSLRPFLADQRKRYPVLQPFTEEEFISQFLLRDQRGKVSKSIVYRDLLEAHSLGDASAAADLHQDYENNFWRFASAFPGMREMFEQLSRAGIRTGIVTNGETHIQMRSLLALNLDRAVDTYLISQSVGLRKPDVQIFRLAAERLGVQPGECVFVGDAPISDISGAQNAGMKAVWFPNGATWPSDLDTSPDAEIGSLSDFIPFIMRRR